LRPFPGKNPLLANPPYKPAQRIRDQHIEGKMNQKMNGRQIRKIVDAYFHDIKRIRNIIKNMPEIQSHIYEHQAAQYDDGKKRDFRFGYCFFLRVHT
jgi:hypothetical protein